MVTDPEKIKAIRNRKLQKFRKALYTALEAMPMGYPGAEADRAKFTLPLEKIIADLEEEGLTG